MGEELAHVQNMGVLQFIKENSWFNSKRMKTLLATCFIGFPLLVVLSTMFPITTCDRLIRDFAKPGAVEDKAGNFNNSLDVDKSNSKAENLTSSFGLDPEAISSETGKRADNKLVNGLLSPAFDEKSCLSRYQSSSYHKNSKHEPSPYLVSKLREYEDRHKRCGPYTESYKKSTAGLGSSGQADNSTTDCKYIVWFAVNGLGNRMLSMASAFLYAILTNRILLIHQRPDMNDVFCEPFPDTTWLLPWDFPLQDQLYDRKFVDSHRYGEFLKQNNISISNVLRRRFFVLYLASDYNYHDKLFYLDQYQEFLQDVSWLILMSDQYFSPSLFLIPSFQAELENLFPDKTTVFHHLGRYLLHPSNKAWGLITRFYQAYLASADERIGLQIRVFDPKLSPANVVLDQIKYCSDKEKILPEVGEEIDLPSPSTNATKKAILITSLYSDYYKNISSTYWTKQTKKREIVGVYQPSHERYQHFGDNMHNVKALAEIYLLSLSEVLVTTAWSTFGYVAQGLGGLKPWILYVPSLNKPSSYRPCHRDISIEPCFHLPHYFDRVRGSMDDVGPFPPFLKHCKDAGWGLKLVDNRTTEAK